MSAKTRQEKTFVLARLGVLCAQAIELVDGGKRDQRQVNLLNDALQAFKENLLSRVERSEGPVQQMSGQELLAFYSNEVSDVGFSSHVLKFCRQRGIRYMGEFLRVTFDRAFAVTVELDQICSGYGIARSGDPLDMGWRPAYVDDPTIRALWKMPAEEFCSKYYLTERHWRHSGDNISTPVGMWLCSPGDLPTSSGLLYVQQRFKRGCPLHAAMVTLDWKPPKTSKKKSKSTGRPLKEAAVSEEEPFSLDDGDEDLSI